MSFMNKIRKTLSNNRGVTITQVIIVILIFIALVIIMNRNGGINAFRSLDHLSVMRELEDISNQLGIESMSRAVSPAMEIHINDSNIKYNGVVDLAPSAYSQVTKEQVIGEGGSIKITYGTNSGTVTGGNASYKYVNSDEEMVTSGAVELPNISPNLENGIAPIVKEEDTQIAKDLFNIVLNLKETNIGFEYNSTDNRQKIVEVNKAVFGHSSSGDVTFDPRVNDRIVYLTRIDTEELQKETGKLKLYNTDKYGLYYVSQVSSENMAVDRLKPILTGSSDAEADAKEMYLSIMTNLKPGTLVLIPQSDRYIIEDSRDSGENIYMLKN